MENKYYIPLIEEFHVGFEFEINDTWGDWKKIILTKELLENPMIPDGSGNECTPYYYKTKVKYLDKEDIESLGWEYDNNAEPYPSKEPYECPIAFNKDTQLVDGICYILYLYNNCTVWIEWIKDCVGMGYIFKGIIKNKSELIKLLEQIGIRVKDNKE